MKQLTSICIVLFIGIGSYAQSQRDVCKMPLSSVWVKMEKEEGYDFRLTGDGLSNYLNLVKDSPYVYLYCKKATGWAMVKECKLPKIYLKSFYYKNGIQYGFTTELSERPILLKLERG
ncbi:MAG: hypothetical protein HUJ25_08115 [Crocinitomicaceae bacterium]|nr:hypothetical protein [Crocinitomicaceae bacterium]